MCTPPAALQCRAEAPMKTKTFALLVLLGTLSAGAADVLVDDFYYNANDTTARAAWQALWGTAPVRVGTVENRSAMTFPCNFAGTKIERATWDRKVKLDLSGADALTFDIFCKDPAPVSSFVIYLESGKGWYSAHFAPPAAGKWGTVILRTEDMGMEGAPGGWAEVRTIRLSAWRGADKDTEFALANLRGVGPKGPVRVLVVKNDSALARSGGERNALLQFPREMTERFRAVGVACRTVSDVELPAILKAVEAPPHGERVVRPMVVLPYAPSLAPEAEAALASHLAAGGKLMAFYQLPRKLAEAIGIELKGHLSAQRPGHFARIVTAGPIERTGMPDAVLQRSWNINRAAPRQGHPAEPRVIATWQDDAGRPTGEPAIILSKRGAFMTHVLLSDDPDRQRRLLLSLAVQLDEDFNGFIIEGLARAAETEDPRQLLDAVKSYLGGAGKDDKAATASFTRYLQAIHTVRGADGARGWVDALDGLAAARAALLDAYGRSLPSAKSEFRGIWCHSAFGPPGTTWDQSIKTLADNGFTAIVPNMLWGGAAYYPSDVLPVDPSVKERGDQIQLCLDACKKYGIECHVWKVNWNMGGHAPRDFAQRMKQENRTQVKFNGQPNDAWLCPTHPANRKLEIDSMVEVAAKYPVDGIHFDYIRYPDGDGCFCPRCREQFEAALGRKVADWPAAVRKDDQIKPRWLEFRREQITAVVEAVSREARKVRPGVKVSAAVFPNWATDRDSIGQDWKVWCEKGWLDFVCPMDYTPHDTEFEAQVSRQVGWAGKVPVYPGIGLSVWPRRNDLAGLAEKVQLARKSGCNGFVVFDYNTWSAQQTLPAMRLGLTKEK